MFLRQIDELETFFKWLDRLNLIAYNVWNDKQRESYQNGHMVQMETLYRTYIADMRQISNELSLMQKQISEAKEEVNTLAKEIYDLKESPEIKGCYGAYHKDKHGNYVGNMFAVSPQDIEDDYGSLALVYDL